MKLMNDIGVIHAKGKRKGYAVVDADMLESLSGFKFFIDRDGYFRAYLHNPLTGKTIITGLHQLVFGTSRKTQIDHKNTYKLDNRRTNLRRATISQNNANCGIKKVPKTSRFKGVSWSKVCKKWVVHIRINGKSKHVGLFEDEIEAASAYNSEALLQFGEFANVNQLK